MEKNQEEQSLIYETFNLLRFPMVVLVVFIHTCIFTSDKCSYVVYHLIRSVISNLMNVAVPVFFFISGFLFYRNIEKWNWNAYINKLRRRIHSLLIPYVLWNTFYIMFALFGTIFAVLVKGVSFSVLTDWYHSEGFYALYWGGPYLYPFWYIRDLIALVVISPIIYGCVNYTSHFFIVILVVLCFFFDMLPSSVFFFSLGAYFCLAGRYRFLTYRWVRYFTIVCYMLLLLIPASFFLQITENMQIINKLVVLVGVIAIFCIGYESLEMRWVRPCKLLAESSFFIFAFHAFLITDSLRLLVNYIGVDSQVKLILNYLLLPFLLVCVCVLTYIILKRIMPKTMAIMTGGR